MSTPPELDESRPRRRESWSLKTIVEEVGGRPMSEYQDPERPSHPYYRWKNPPPLAPVDPPLTHLGTRALARPPADDGEGEEIDPVLRVYPPLTGETGRRLHGVSNEHHRETLETVKTVQGVPEPGQRLHPPGPAKRPERIYLHYLLLHVDRLSDHALRYLERAVREELAHRHPEDSGELLRPPASS